MKRERISSPQTVFSSLNHRHESGVALLTVLSLLAVFAIILVGFTLTIRFEENTVQNYQESVSVQEGAESAVQGVLGQLSRDMDPRSPKNVLGRKQARYVSKLDPWYTGYAGQVDPQMNYDARAFMSDNRPEVVVQRRGLRGWPVPIPRGIDEDPQGDVTGRRDPTSSLPTGFGDGAPGLAGVDDNLDGIVDNIIDVDGDGRADNSLNHEDDDEDFIANEDGYDLRRPDSSGGQFFFTPGTGYDNDGDSVGVFDESAKININLAGNNFSPNQSYTYNLGTGPHELDLEVFLFNRIVRYSNNGSVATFSQNNAQAVASQVVNFRYGSTADGGGAFNAPGNQNQDDNNNNNPEIVLVEELSDAFQTSTFEGEPFMVVGNSQDDDDDGLLNEEDEIYIGPTTANLSGSPLDEPIGQVQSNMEQFRRGDMIDNDGDGFIDEEDEGVDDPSEFNIFKPKGDDRPFASVDDLNLIAALRNQDGEIPSGVVSPPPGMFDILRQKVTIWNQSDEVSGPLSAGQNEVAKINPNAAYNWRPVDVWVRGGSIDNRADSQYSAPLKLEELFPLQVDDDGDWNLNAEPDMALNQANGIDDNGNGRVDEPSDDWDGNGYPSGDFDGYAEVDVGSPSFIENGRDDDDDGQQFDEGRNQDVVVDRMLRLPRDEEDYNDRPRDESEVQIRLGMVVEGDGLDSDGDGLIDDIGDFNGDGLLTYDPEWGVNEDPFGDGNGDGYPGLGADIDAENDTAEDDIIRDPQRREDVLITSFADDDRDGAADFYDPQVLAAMYAPEMDGVDNDSDGEVDEIGERYIAAFDDDEDGRMDDDGPEFQIALNLYDYVDTWTPQLVANSPDIRDILGMSEDDAVIADPVTFKTVRLNSTRQRSFRMHPRMLVGPNQNSREQQTFIEEMRFLMPNPPQTDTEVTYEGVESIRINEVMAKPVIRIEAEEALEQILFNPNNPNEVPAIVPNRRNFQVSRGSASDDGVLRGVEDTNWGGTVVRTDPANPGQENRAFTHSLLPNGYEHTYNPILPFVNNDAKAPAFVFHVTNVVPDPNVPSIGTQPEMLTLVYENIPEGIYDIVLYMDPAHTIQPEVQYLFNGEEIPMRSDTAVINRQTFEVVPVSSLPPRQREIIRRDTGMLNRTYSELVTGNDSMQALQLPYRLSYWPEDLDEFQERFTRPRTGRVEVGSNNRLVVEIRAMNTPEEFRATRPTHYTTSIDRIELINPFAQYVELVNISNEDIDLAGWQVSTPYGTYSIPEDTIIPRMKPASGIDDGRDRPTGEGLAGSGVPSEPLLNQERFGQTLDTEDLLLEDNKVLLAYHEDLLIDFIEDNYPNVANLSQRVVEPERIESEREEIIQSLNNLFPGDLLQAQGGDLRFRLFDTQQDVLTHNAEEKQITLYDPAGNYQDSFRYRTTFNNELTIIQQVNGGVMPDLNIDLIALPGYKGMEAFERADPTHFENKIIANSPAASIVLERSVPSSIKLAAKDAMVVDVVPRRTGGFERGFIGGYIDRNNEQDFNQPTLTRFADSQRGLFSADFRDTWWNGWDFIGDYYDYPSEMDRRDRSALTVLTNAGAMAREAVSPDEEVPRMRFYEMLGGFENTLDIRRPRDTRYTAFIWRMGLRELIRAGYDPDVDDQLTVRVLGRQYIADGGDVLPIDLPVGEVLVNPDMNVVDPGERPLDRRPDMTPNEENNFFSTDGFQSRVPVFSKLRHGDTAYTINLREQFNELYRDLENSSDDEPMIEIMVVMRKSTRDMTVSLNRQPITGEERPDFAIRDTLVVASGGDPILPAVDPDLDGRYVTSTGSPFRAAVSDDNYFFKGVELFGRGRGVISGRTEQVDRLHRYLGGTPGRDNTGYVPAYPRRRLDLRGNNRDTRDIIDNTAFIKNGPLATIGELSRLHTGNRFETVNTPLIPQRVEDKSVTEGRIFTNREIGQRISGDNNEFRIQLAQRERLDQWEGRYTNLYNMITTAVEGINPGKLNINTAPREVLAALPSTPPIEPGQIAPLQMRHFFNNLVADFIIEGRQPTGRDMAFGVAEIDDDEYIASFSQVSGELDVIPEFKFVSTGRQPRWYKSFDRIKTLRFDRMGIEPEDVTGNQLDLDQMSLSTIMSLPDDGPYANIGTLLSDMVHMNRRDRFAGVMRRAIDRTGDVRPESPGDLRERILAELSDQELTTEDMEAIMNRVSNLITVRSRSFTIRSRGRVFDQDGNVVAQRTLETVYAP